MPYKETPLITVSPKGASTGANEGLSMSRRDLLKQLIVTSSGAIASTLGVASFISDVQAMPVSIPKSLNECDDPLGISIPYQGMHQAGIITKEQVNALFIAFQITARDRAALKKMFQTLTKRIAYLTQGGDVNTAHERFPPPESGILGTYINPDSLTITVSVGASIFDARYGLALKKPKNLIEMPDFPNDALKNSWCDGDMLLQICANTLEIGDLCGAGYY